MLAAYKAQHAVERGFLFLKDSQVIGSSFFVKNPQRVEALLFIMTLCLLIHSLLEYKIRKGLEEQKKTVPDQKESKQLLSQLDGYSIASLAFIS